ncbi:hypothetical protein BO78DRAFT_394683 [Aspergillus sclerotiicarbonarius CBS 121057]|uniref:Protein kinase domain-containing protein n=1 Tax=Aspergillus sclerotiicarbonarius (strain CBS 121057 / IBT 28362) TaxID=1448318 RepID=A0A319EHK0_ASPSB|nr:hypothetical protein BO78DRAFT_394683 [Aspergillus sclerotiicarbonarius CBS 121057]
MEEEIARLRRQLEEAEQRHDEDKRRQEEAERRQEEAEQRQKEAEQRQKEAEQRQKELERRLKPNTLRGLLAGCHRLSRALKVETRLTLTTQGDTTNPVNRLLPARIAPWDDFPSLQEEVWRRIENAGAFMERALFPSNNDLDFVRSTVSGKRINSEISLQNFERKTVDDLLEMIINALTSNEEVRRQFHIQGQVVFQDRPDPESLTEQSLEETMDHLHIGATQEHSQPGSSNSHMRPHGQAGRRRNRRADQFCVHVDAGESRKPVYVVEFKAPHKLTLPELIVGLHEMRPAQDVIDQDGDTFEFHATRLVAAVITQIFSYMIDTGVQYGYICTGQAFVFLHIPEDPTTVYYYLCVPNEDVEADGDNNLHRTAVGQVLAFTLTALVAGLPPQEWHDAAQERLATWKVEYFDVLRDIPETIRKEPPSSVYKPSSWKPMKRSPYNTRSKSTCRPHRTTPEATSGESTDTDGDLQSPSLAPAARGRRGRGSRNQATAGRGRGRVRGRGDGQNDAAGSRNMKEQLTRQYCTMGCIRGLATGGQLDPRCPNVGEHGNFKRHRITAKQFIYKLHAQLKQSRSKGFEQLHIRGRTGFMLKASLLSHGYTVIIKGTTARREHSLQMEIDTYRHLRTLQGYQIPVCLGDFELGIPYWYHGELLTRMMVLGWSGIRAHNAINRDNASSFESERTNLLDCLQSHGIVHRDSAWRNILWDESAGRLVMIDLEEVSWTERRLPLMRTSGNAPQGPPSRKSKGRRGGYFWQ